MKNYGAPIFISKDLTIEEASIENALLMKRRVLIEQDQKNKKDLTVKDGRLYEETKSMKPETNEK